MEPEIHHLIVEVKRKRTFLAFRFRIFFGPAREQGGDPSDQRMYALGFLSTRSIIWGLLVRES
jgi:hypothetical protein